jgi:hypothetical protein
MIGGSRILYDLARVWRIMVEIKTSQGPINVKIPMFDENIREMVQACG